MQVAIVGAGPAGSHLAHQLSHNGAQVLLFDARPAWEKPCGGGVTSKALREFEFLHNGDAPKQMISSLRLISAQGRELTVAPRHDFAIYSRRELAVLMRERAIEAGARLHIARVEKTEFSGGQWHLETSAGDFKADFLVGADGASSVIRRRVGLKFAAQDFAYALGWNVKTAQPPTRVDVKYLRELSGYLWLFPRHDHISYGIASGYQETTPARLKEILLAYIETENPAAAREIREGNGKTTANTQFYAAILPALDVSTWDRLSACNAANSWALIGDAAGFVDPLTGEGIYYAVKSADLLARAMASHIADFDPMWRAEFGAELRRAAELSDRFYYGNFAGARLTERMLQFASRHRGVRETLRDLVAGDQGYVTLKTRLIKSAFSFI
ncbi:MAG TPA: NAD(P)/FAD-dependent oxidoreductase [Blastocatellia bacterium]|nr:NAD(P)/FAD-dependent oxidoreductase [Blastocatellia bacterium]HMV87005.1 NAD(P)/FAD-dependent oxidoreductase [Blastocatellia bacterium]HMX29790.1 NAD(P)/FAD-dependent oxidoreductase [Blastocatellia bacterium]HMY71709.1 NAD(P)/FAD-dependent oxidoreductase [Blastocatellia bacterium]HMZ22204.1 NAD(P)/FAD-dependent oxidoreductase [Blastocatellia bacterium]